MVEKTNNVNENNTKITITAMFLIAGLGIIAIFVDHGYNIKGGGSVGTGRNKKSFRVNCTPNGGREQIPSPSGARIPQGRSHPLVSSGKK